MSYDMLQEQQVDRLLAVPLKKKNKIIGFLGVDNPRNHYDDPTLLSSIQYFIINSIERKEKQHQLEDLSYRDMLTGLSMEDNELIEKYLNFLAAAKTESESVTEAIRIAGNAGFPSHFLPVFHMNFPVDRE